MTMHRIDSPGVNDFIQLGDVPNSYAGKANDFVVVNSLATGLTFISGGGGVTIGNPVSGGDALDVLFVDPSGNLGQDDEFQWNPTNHALMLGVNLVGTASPSYPGAFTGPYNLAIQNLANTTVTDILGNTSSTPNASSDRVWVNDATDSGVGSPIYDIGFNSSVGDTSFETFANAFPAPDTVTTLAGDILQSATLAPYNNMVLQFSNVGGSLPTGISALTNYYVINSTSGSTNQFQLSLTYEGSPISITGGSGTNTWNIFGADLQGIYDSGTTPSQTFSIVTSASETVTATFTLTSLQVTWTTPLTLAATDVVTGDFPFSGITGGNTAYQYNTDGKTVYINGTAGMTFDWLLGGFATSNLSMQLSDLGLQMTEDLAVNENQVVHFNGIGDTIWTIGEKVASGGFIVNSNAIVIDYGSNVGEGLSFQANGNIAMEISGNTGAVHFVNSIVDASGNPSANFQDRYLLDDTNTAQLTWDDLGVYLPVLTPGSLSMLTLDTTGLIGVQTIPGGSIGGTISANQIAIGAGSNSIYGDSNLQASSGGNIYSPYLDTSTGTMVFNSYGVTELSLSDNTGIQSIGDIGGDWYSDLLRIDGTNRLITFQDSGEIYFKIDNTNRIYGLGDFGSVGNTTTFAINDTTQEFIFSGGGFTRATISAVDGSASFANGTLLIDASGDMNNEGLYQNGWTDNRLGDVQNNSQQTYIQVYDPTNTVNFYGQGNIGITFNTDSGTASFANTNFTIDASGNVYIAGYIKDTSGFNSADFNNHILDDTTGASSVLWDSRTLVTSNVTVLDWASLYMNDATGVESIDWTNRYLYGNSQQALEWGVVNTQVNDANYGDVQPFFPYGSLSAGTTYSSHFENLQGTPSATYDIGSGNTGTLVMVGLDQSFLISFTTGATPATGGTTIPVMEVVYDKSFQNPKYPTISPADPNSAQLTGTSQVFIDSWTNTGFTLEVGTTGLLPLTSYTWSVSVGP